MSKFYATIVSDFNHSKTATRRGFNGISTYAQSHDGTVRTTLYYKQPQNHKEPPCLMVMVTCFAESTDGGGNILSEVEMPFSKFVETVKFLNTQEV
jgi:hypothetical protein